VQADLGHVFDAPVDEAVVGLLVQFGPLLLPNRIHEIALMVATGQTPPTYIPLVSGLLLSAVFVVAAIWRFKKTEF
jgi:hypothetical protein